MSEVGAQTPAAASPFAPATARTEIGVVAIGRNEGDRLRQCLESIGALAHHAVYVDSGSTDGSPEMARGLGVDVVDLDMGIPFTAARARNEGLRRLKQRMPGVRYVQFVDGDCEVVAGWMTTAAAFLDAHPRVAAACGRRRERHPENSVYNRLCDIEWNTPVGEDAVFGGDVMIRAQDMKRSGGYDATLIAGEDPDLAVRIRKMGRKVLRVEQDMTLHDAGMTRFSQWWTRALRGGHAFAEGAERHADQHFWAREVRSNWAWGAALPAFGIGMLVPTLGTSAVLAAAGYGTLFARVLKDAQARGLAPREARMYAVFCTIAKVPQAAGQAKYWWGRVRKKRSGLIEYKDR